MFQNHEALFTILIKTKHVKKKIQSSSNKYQNAHNLQRKKKHILMHSIA